MVTEYVWVSALFSTAEQNWAVPLQLPPAHVQLVAGAPPEQTACSVTGVPMVPVADPEIEHPVSGPVPFAGTQVMVTLPP
jgi:hypothetical protein